jgi:anaerobic ribonucleoside-triphosphate reductase
VTRKISLKTKGGFKKMKRTKCEIYSRVVGYLRPTIQWNEGKQEEFKDRELFNVCKE